MGIFLSFSEPQTMIYRHRQESFQQFADKNYLKLWGIIFLLGTFYVFFHAESDTLPAERRRLPGSEDGGTPSASSNNLGQSSSNASTDSTLEEKSTEKEFDELFKLKDEFYSDLLPHCGVELSSDGVWTVKSRRFFGSKKQTCKEILCNYLNADKPFPGFFRQKFAQIDAIKKGD